MPRVEVEEGGGMLLGFLFRKHLVGTGFSSLQLAKAPGKGRVLVFGLTGEPDSTVHCYS